MRSPTVIEFLDGGLGFLRHLGKQCNHLLDRIPTSDRNYLHGTQMRGDGARQHAERLVPGQTG